MLTYSETCLVCRCFVCFLFAPWHIFHHVRTWCVTWERHGLSDIATVTEEDRSLRQLIARKKSEKLQLPFFSWQKWASIENRQHVLWWKKVVKLNYVTHNTRRRSDYSWTMLQKLGEKNKHAKRHLANRTSAFCIPLNEIWFSPVHNGYWSFPTIF